ncbi:SPFH domain-containing protein [Mycobacterium sp. SMC-4]|uniref:SPFH domain-containing protein n=1 Tax=Mycobacterium sp. SMC-4 TaxID=2857059 RepID=UPI0021B48762|nr:SPFH domain-containing protein [Mycobacterium sp. SMC-4]UXA16471.1 SPFH domain-containing protein [Mycobacterium sp. SMC-4]
MTMVDQRPTSAPVADGKTRAEQPADPDLTERPARAISGVPFLVVEFVLAVLGVLSVIAAQQTGWQGWWLVTTVIAVTFLVILASFYTLAPNQAAVLTFFGAYRGTDRGNGLRIANPLYSGAKISLRVRNFNTTSSKVNDANGNPIHIAAVVVWQVVDTARASFGVDHFIDYVHVQSESAVRQMARAYPYESFEDDNRTTLIGEPAQVNESLLDELQERADAAGVRVLEARVTDLSYAAEVAEAMLRRQQAAAIVAGRRKIVEGAVGMVRHALSALEQGSDSDDAVPLDHDRRASFAANLMTVIASDSPTNPVLNVGATT